LEKNVNTFYTLLLLKAVSFLEDTLCEDDMFSVTMRLKREAEGWCSVARPQAPALVNPAAAVSALGELTPGGALMKGFEEESLARKF
jgi:hypothetical protein